MERFSCRYKQSAAVRRRIIESINVHNQYTQYCTRPHVNIIISNSSGKPIYEQITAQIKRMILSGELEDGAALPSMRLLAKELRISVITTKRAYTDLERDGFIETVVGKGSFVSRKNPDIIREQQLKIAEEYLQKAADTARTYGITKEELQEMLDTLFDLE